jgi:hypothetical protein
MSIEPVYHTLGKKLDERPMIRLMPPGQCAYCDAHRNDLMMPYHTPSPRCESGKRPHCTCDTCF